MISFGFNEEARLVSGLFKIAMVFLVVAISIIAVRGGITPRNVKTEDVKIVNVRE